MPSPTGLIQQLDQFLHRRGLLAPEERILAACSGGADSTALLRLLHQVNQSRFWRWKIIVGHVDHGIRGAASTGDRRFVMQLGRQLGLPVRVQKLHLKNGSARRVSEAAARQARMRALAQMARRANCSAVALAHHADDQAETVLMRLLRGAGMRGLAGMAQERKIASTRSKRPIRLIRPLLQLPRRELLAWLEQIGQDWREDSSNQDSRFLRNRVRHELLPLLETYQPRIREALWRMAQNSRTVHQMLNRRAAQLLKKSAARRGRKMVLQTASLAQAPRAIAALALREAIATVGGTTDRIHQATLLDAIERIRRGQTHGTLQFAGHAVVKFSPKSLAIGRASAKRKRKKAPTMPKRNKRP
jgi:tRNA(Ile)-lysidine synthase